MDDASAEITQKAISAALTSNWEEALKLNSQIISQNPENVDAVNRIARAYFELGDLAKSKKNYETALKIDPYNQIAFKFLKRIETFKKKHLKTELHKSGSPVIIHMDSFIEEPGRTKLVNLLKVAEPQKLSVLSPGAKIELMTKNRVVVVVDEKTDYLGVLPDDLSRKLIRLIRGGNKYNAFIKAIKTNSITILIRETFRSSRFKNQPSFLENLNGTHAYSSDLILVSDNDQASEDSGSEDESS